MFTCMFQLSNELCGFRSNVIGDVKKHCVKKHKLNDKIIKINKELVVNKNSSRPGKRCTQRDLESEISLVEKELPTREDPNLLLAKSSPVLLLQETTELF